MSDSLRIDPIDTTPIWKRETMMTLSKRLMEIEERLVAAEGLLWRTVPILDDLKIQYRLWKESEENPFMSPALLKESRNLSVEVQQFLSRLGP